MSDGERDGYIAAVATRFLRFGCHRLFLSPRDYELISDWHDRGVPLPAVIRGIDTAYLARLRGKRRYDLPPRALTFARRQVERSWETQRELDVGRRSSKEASRRSSREREAAAKLAEALLRAADLARARSHTHLAAHIDAVRAGLLARIEAGADTIAIEDWLEAESAANDDLLCEAAGAAVVDEARGRAERDLSEYRTRAAFHKYVETLARAIVRKEYPLPLLTVLA